MEFATPVIPACLVRRHKRFFADVRLPDSSKAVVHYPSPRSTVGITNNGIQV